MVFIDDKKLNKELEDLGKYLSTRKLSPGEEGLLLGNYIPYKQIQQQKEMEKNMIKKAPGKSIAKPTKEKTTEEEILKDARQQVNE